MGLFDLINPLSPIKLTKKILDSDDMDLEEFGEKLLSKPYRPGGILINAIDLIEPEENRKAVYGDVIGWCVYRQGKGYTLCVNIW